MSEWTLTGKSYDELNALARHMQKIDPVRAYGVLITWRDDHERVSVERELMQLENEILAARVAELEGALAEYE
jgi:hypothetical protein